MKYIIVFVLCFFGLLIIGNICNDMVMEKSYIDGDDPKNPLKFAHLNISNGVKWTADFIVDSDDNPHEKTMKYMKYIEKNIEWDTPSQKPMPYPHLILQDGKGYCGDRSILLTAFLTTQNIPARVIGMYGYNDSAHVTVEVYYNNSWHMYDPSYVAYWIKDGNILSFEELQHESFDDLMLVVNSNREDHQYLVPEVYMYSSPSGELGLDKPMWWDEKMSVNETIISRETPSYNEGLRYIGASYINVFQNWTFSNLTPGSSYSFIIYPKEIWGSDEFEFYSDRGDAYVINGVHVKPLFVNFTAVDNCENIRFWHDYNKTDVLMIIDKYELKSIANI